MKLRHSAVLVFFLLPSCGPNSTSVDESVLRAEAAAARAESLANQAEDSANQASGAASHDQRIVGDAEDSARRAGDVVQRFCAVPGLAYGCSTNGQCWPTPEYLRYRKIQEEAWSSAYQIQAIPYPKTSH